MGRFATPEVLLLAARAMFARKKNESSFPGIPFHDMTAPARAAPGAPALSSAVDLAPGSPTDKSSRKKWTVRSASGFFSGNDFAGSGSYEAPLKLALLSPRKSRTKRSVSVSSTATSVAREDSPTKKLSRLTLA